MSKSVLFSISPFEYKDITKKSKDLLIKVTAPKLETPFKGYLYEGDSHSAVYASPMVRGRMKVVGEFICDEIIPFEFDKAFDNNANCCSKLEQSAAMEKLAIVVYTQGKDFFGIHISGLVIYDNPVSLSEFSAYDKKRDCEIKRIPRGWCFVKDKGSFSDK